MQGRQKAWLYLLILFSLLHIVRDIFQDLGINNFLSIVLASPGPPKVSLGWYWTIFNTYIFAITEIALSLICLKRNYFGNLGNTTIFLALSGLLLWSFYYFVL